MASCYEESILLQRSIYLLDLEGAPDSVLEELGGGWSMTQLLEVLVELILGTTLLLVGAVAWRWSEPGLTVP